MQNPHKKRKIQTDPENGLENPAPKEETEETHRSFSEANNPKQATASPKNQYLFDSKSSNEKIVEFFKLLEKSHLLLHKNMDSFEIIQHKIKTNRDEYFITKDNNGPMQIYKHEFDLENTEYMDKLQKLIELQTNLPELPPTLPRIEGMFFERSPEKTTLYLNILTKHQPNDQTFFTWLKTSDHQIMNTDGNDIQEETLQDIMLNNKRSFAEIQQVLLDIISTLNFLHENNVFVGQNALCPENLYFTRSTSDTASVTSGVRILWFMNHHYCPNRPCLLASSAPNLEPNKILLKNYGCNEKKRSFSAMIEDTKSTTCCMSMPHDANSDMQFFLLLLLSIFSGKPQEISEKHVRDRIDSVFQFEPHEVVKSSIISEIKEILVLEKKAFFEKNLHSSPNFFEALSQFMFLSQKLENQEIFENDDDNLLIEALKYVEGDERERNYTKGCQIYKYLAFERKYAPGIYMHGVCLLYGMGVSGYDKRLGKKMMVASIKEAFDNFENNEKLTKYPRHVNACLGYGYNMGIGVKQDNQKALHYFEKAIAAGHIGCLNIIGEFCQEGIGCQKDFKTAISHYERAANKNECGALYNLAIIHEEGDASQGIPRDCAKAFAFCKLSAELGFLRAQTKLGVMFDFGIGCQKNDQQAFFWYHKAASRGDAEAQHNLALMYEFGQFVQKDYNHAIELFKKSANQGNSHSLNKLGKYYLHGIGQGILKKNHRKAFHCFKLGAKTEATPHNIMMGVLALNGLGTKENCLDYKNAEKYLKMAVAHNDNESAVAQQGLKMMEEDGKLSSFEDSGFFEEY